jgi:CheY-like chemotaxis protein
MADDPGPAILVIDDSPEDFEVTLRALRRTGLRHRLLRCATGDEALDFLRRRGRFRDSADAPRPSMILLDLNLPGTDGREVLQEIKRTAELAPIPVIVLTTSDDGRDVRACYRAGANSYIKKPIDLDAFMGAIEQLSTYWFDVAILPGEG